AEEPEPSSLIALRVQGVSAASRGSDRLSEIMNARRTLWLLAWAVAFVPFAACTGVEFAAASGVSGGSVDGGDCPPDRKLCDGACVPLDLPGYGCARDTCAPCDLTNASAKCEAGACAVDICVGSFADCDLLPDNGCEVNLNSSAQCGVC